MIELYVNLVKNKKRTCNPENKSVKPVPERHIDEVLAALKVEGYDGDGNKIKN